MDGATTPKVTTTTTTTMNELPNDTILKQSIYTLLQKIDIETMGIKSFIQLLANEMKVSYDVLKNTKKEYIKEILTKAMNEVVKDNNNKNNTNEQDDHEEEEEEEEDDDDDDEEEDEHDGSNGNKKGEGRGLNQKKEISMELAKFLKVKDRYMARTEIVKQLWNYIRTNQLQNPNNKREILLDDAMQNVFHCPTFTMFTMNKYIGAHIHPYKPVDLTTMSSSSSNKKRSASTSGSSGTNNHDRSCKKRSRTSTTSTTKVRKVGTQPPYLLSDALSAIVGTNILPRPQVVSKIWDYIRTNQLQNPNDKREILCDDALKKVMNNCNKISMFQMNVHISKHLLEKVDRSQYKHDDDEGDDDDDNED